MSKKRLNKLILILAHMIVFMWVSFAWAGELQDAKNAYGAGRFEEAAKLLRPLVRQENVDAVYLQARMYEKGDGVSKDQREARRLYSIAALGGHEAAQQKLDVLNVQNTDKSVVIDWYLPAAQEGDTEAQYNLGFMYETGWGVPENTTEAIRWYREASEMQHDVAQLRLAMMTIVGVGVKSSMRDGLELLHQSAENGNRIAEILVQDMFDVGDVGKSSAKQIVSGIRRIFDDGEEATIKTLRRSLEALRRGPTDSPSLSDLDVEDEIEKPIDVVKAVTQSTPIVKKRSPVVESSNQASNKKIVTRKQSTLGRGNTFKWYIEEATNGEPDAQYHLGVLYIKGDQVEKDIDEGLHWMKRAAEQGHELALIYTKLWEDEFDQNSFSSTIAVAWLKNSAREWNQQSVFTLGTLYETGRGVEKNFKRATQWYKFAAVNGHSNAKRRLALIRKGGALLEKEGVSRRGENSVSSESSLMMLAIIALIMGIAAFVYIKYFKPNRISAPEKYQERLVMEKAKNSQGLQADDRKFFDDLWGGDKPEKIVVATKESKPAVAAEKTVEEKPQPVVAVEAKAEVKAEPEEAPKSEKLSMIEEKLAKAIEDLIVDGGAIAEVKPVVTANKPVEAKAIPVEKKSEPAPQIQASDVKSSIEKLMDSTSAPYTPEPLSSGSMTAAPSNPIPEQTPDHNEVALGADSFINNSISIDELAASRISADRLFADGVAIDEAGRAVGQGSYNPHKLDADAVVFDEASSISSKSVSAKWDDDKVKPRPVGAAASLLPKQSLDIKSEIDPITFDTTPEPETVETHDVDAPMTNDEERSLAEVHFNIGLMFSSGDGVPKNETQAAKWFLKAAEEGLPEGQFSLGQAYLNGNGVVQNTELALDWIQKASDNGHKPAQDTLKAQNKAI